MRGVRNIHIATSTQHLFWSVQSSDNASIKRMRKADVHDIEGMASCLRNPPVARERKLARQALKTYTVIVAGPEGSRQINGWIAYRNLYPSRVGSPEPDHVHIHRLFVREDNQSAGLGKALIRIALNEGARCQLPVRVQATTAAVPYFRKRGFGVVTFDPRFCRTDVKDMWYGWEEKSASPRISVPTPTPTPSRSSRSRSRSRDGAGVPRSGSRFRAEQK